MKLTDPTKYHRLYEYVADLDIWSEISQQKISLANFVANQVGVEIIPEDRTRIALALARTRNKQLSVVNHILEQECGDYFQLPKSFSVKGKNIPFEEITSRASEIVNGLENTCYLSIEGAVKEIMPYFRVNSIIDKDKLLQIKQATFNLMMKMRDPSFFTNMENFKELIRPELISYYRLTNRTELDIKSLENNDPDFDEISRFVYMMAEVVTTKLRLIDKNLSPSDAEQAQKLILRQLGKIEFRDRISVEEWARFRTPLPKKQVK